jgi:hypothetical protein
MVKLAHCRPMLFATDARYSKKNLDMMCIQAKSPDEPRALASMQRLKVMGEKYDAEPFFPHDAESYASYQKVPYPYI